MWDLPDQGRNCGFLHWCRFFTAPREAPALLPCNLVCALKQSDYLEMQILIVFQWLATVLRLIPGFLMCKRPDVTWLLPISHPHLWVCYPSLLLILPLHPVMLWNCRAVSLLVFLVNPIPLPRAINHYPANSPGLNACIWVSNRGFLYLKSKLGTLPVSPTPAQEPLSSVNSGHCLFSGSSRLEVSWGHVPS